MTLSPHVRLALSLLVLAASARAGEVPLSKYPTGYAFIDCGDSETLVPGSEDTYTTNTTSLGVVTYTVTPGTKTFNVTTQPNLSPQESTGRYFPSTGLGCYRLNLSPNSWSVRLGFAYYSYDGMNSAPNFTVSLQGTVVDQVALDDWEDPGLWDSVGTAPGGGSPGTAHYTEYVVKLETPTLEVCLENQENLSPILNSLEVVPLQVPEMDQLLPEVNWTLSLKHRYNLGGPALGPAIEDDYYLRRWESRGINTDVFFYFPLIDLLVPTYSNVSLANSTATVALQEGVPYFPGAVFKTALQGGLINNTDPLMPQFLGIRFHYFPLDSTNHLLARLLFAEIDGNVTRPGQRVFNITFASKVMRDRYLWEGAWQDFDKASDYDIFKSAGGARDVGTYVPFMGCHPEPLYYRTNRSLFLFLSSQDSSLPPLLSGIEFYEVVAPSLGMCPPLSMQPFFNASISDNYPPVTTINPNDTSSPEGPSVGAVVGIAVACIVAGVALVVGIVFLFRLRAEQRATSFARFHQEEGLVA